MEHYSLALRAAVDALSNKNEFYLLLQLPL